MSSSWNILMDIHRRESGICNSVDFQRTCLGSRFMVEKINPSHFVGESCFARPIDFNVKGDLLCSTSGNSILVYDWSNNKLKHKFDSGILLRRANFLNYGDDNFEILATDLYGTIVRYSITSTGEEKSSVYNTGKSFATITPVPKKPFEVIGVQRAGKIFQLDLRASQTVCANESVCDDDGVPVQLNDVDHHPFDTEVCISGYPGFLRVFDTRNFKKDLFKFSMQHLPISYKLMEIPSCIYNYNGTEILTNNFFAGINAEFGDNDDNCLIIFKNKIHDSGKIIATGDDVGIEAAFFGPKSEYIIDAEVNRINFYCISFQEFNINKIETIIKIDLGSASEYETHVSYVKPHPFLPVIASKPGTPDTPIRIWAPTNK